MVKRARGVPYLALQDANGNPIKKQAKGRALDEFLRQMDDRDYWKTIPSAGEMQSDLVLTEEEIQLIQRLEEHQYADQSYDPYQPFEDFFTKTLQKTPLSAAPEPKSRFIESKWERQKIMKIVLAIRKGFIKVDSEDSETSSEGAAPMIWDIWGDESLDSKAEDQLAPRISAPKVRLPDDSESYNPPAHLLPTPEQAKKWKEATHAEDRDRNFLVQRFESFRHIPGYDQFIQERFSRCLDLYLCPRALRKRIFVENAESLLPPMPDIADLRPFPTKLALEYLGHQGKVNCVSIDPSGNWMLSSSEDCSIRLWEVESGRCHKKWNFSSPTAHVQWNPKVKGVFCFSSDSTLFVGQTEREAGADNLFSSDGEWNLENEMLQIPHAHPIVSVAWHSKGDYFCSVCSDSNNSIVQVHLLSKQRSQNPFKRATKGLVRQAIFHPFKAHLLVAWQKCIKIFNLAPAANEQPLLKRVNVGVASISWMDIHQASGGHLLVASHDSRVMWFDLDLMGSASTSSDSVDTAYKNMRYHKEAVKCVKFHPRFPFFASCGDDATIQLFHGRVWEDDAAKDPLIVPLHVIRGNAVVDSVGVLGLDFHPTEPWLFAATSENSVKLYT